MVGYSCNWIKCQVQFQFFEGKSFVATFKIQRGWGKMKNNVCAMLISRIIIIISFILFISCFVLRKILFPFRNDHQPFIANEWINLIGMRTLLPNRCWIFLHIRLSTFIYYYYFKWSLKVAPMGFGHHFVKEIIMCVCMGFEMVRRAENSHRKNNML